MCGGTTTYGWKDPGRMFQASVTGMDYNTTYYYTYGSNITGWSKENYFKSPGISVQMKSTSFGIVGGEPLLFFQFTKKI